MSKTIYSGLEGCGKSYMLAKVCGKLVHRNSKFFDRTNIKRPIVSNMKFNAEFTKYAEEKNVPIGYWENLDDLIKLRDCDVIIDEVGNYFDSRLWADLSLDVRRWLTQGSKCGIEIYGSAQDFAQVDKSFRRLVNDLEEISKGIGSPRPSATRPPVTRIWGVCFMRSIRPSSYKEDDKQYIGTGFPKIFFLEKKYCEIFDTGQKILRSKYPKLRHEERDCELENCGFHKVFHL